MYINVHSSRKIIQGIKNRYIFVYNNNMLPVRCCIQLGFMAMKMILGMFCVYKCLIECEWLLIHSYFSGSCEIPVPIKDTEIKLSTSDRVNHWNLTHSTFHPQGRVNQH